MQIRDEGVDLRADGIGGHGGGHGMPFDGTAGTPSRQVSPGSSERLTEHSVYVTVNVSHNTLFGGRADGA